MLKGNALTHMIVWCMAICIAACNGSEDDPVYESPQFKSSIPSNGTEDIALDTEIIFTFDEVISVLQPNLITVNGEATSASAQLSTLKITHALQSFTSYTIVVAAGAIENSFGVALEQDVTITFVTKDTDVHYNHSLITENPSPEVINLYDFLWDNYGTKTISASQANVNWNLNEAEWVHHHTGKYPAMATFDYIHLPYSPANWIDYGQMDFIKAWWENNGICAASWHWLVPPSEGNTEISDMTYKTETTFKAANVPIDGTWENTFAKADLDKLADYLFLFQENNIPLIWRPLHEAAGNTYVYNNGTAWFWWGSDGPQAYVELWRFVYDYLSEKGLNNLIWVWTTQTNDPAFYPGDEYVDIIGRDIYNNNAASDISEEFQQIQNRYPEKMVTLSEMGSVAKFSEQWNAGAQWSYFMPWYEYTRTNDVNNYDFLETSHEHADINWWQDAFNQSYVITRDQMPSLKQ